MQADQERTAGKQGIQKQRDRELQAYHPQAWLTVLSKPPLERHNCQLWFHPGTGLGPEPFIHLARDTTHLRGHSQPIDTLSMVPLIKPCIDVGDKLIKSNQRTELGTMEVG